MVEAIAVSSQCRLRFVVASDLSGHDDCPGLTHEKLPGVR